ncbi:MAG: glycosyltransferase family 2 protein [Bacteroidetes bacterium]|nr:glycosyltransferase family 2 protein [Bacteroidota bacterium]
MNFAGDYLLNHVLYSQFIKVKPNDDLFLIIVIPCFNEPYLIKTLESIWICDRPNCSVEIIVVINASINNGIIELEQNRKSEIEFNEWEKKHNEKKINFHLVSINNFPIKDAGVGLARKIGMDEAVRRFDYLGKKDGVIVGFDADCTCKTNYLIEIENIFKKNKNLNACSIQFEHQLQGNEFDDFTYNAIASYELYLRYYISALKYAGHPYAYQTIGSSFAVKADVYCKQGGMNKRKAGEDFYFLQKVIQLGNYAELNTTKVFPSPRASNRVPFGTGATIKKMLENKSSNYLTYNLKAFNDIEQVVIVCKKMFGSKDADVKFVLTEFSEPLQKFLIENNFVKNILEINENSNSQTTFQQRFFKWFNMFKVLKYMNFSHPAYYPFVNITESAIEFLKLKGIVTNNKDAMELCEDFRKNKL